MPSRFFFLHWGPGSSAAVERACFGNTLPVEWWDQPRPREGLPESPYFQIVSAAVRRAEELARANADGKIGLIGHSFGGRIAMEVAARIPDRISSLTLLAAELRGSQAFLNLGRALRDSSLVDAEKKAALAKLVADAEAAFSAATFWPLIQSIAATPDYFSLYWGTSARSAETRERYRLLERDAPAFDFACFQSVMSDYLAQGLDTKIERSPYAGPVRMIVGANDPLSGGDEALREWRKVFPQIGGFETLPSGHFIHFERASSEWFPSG